MTALLICSVIVVLFLGAFINVDASKVVAWLFVAGMATMMGALLTFLREITMAAKKTRLGLTREAIATQRKSSG